MGEQLVVVLDSDYVSKDMVDEVVRAWLVVVFSGGGS